MKNAKKLLALILGIILAMGCLSVSAASSTLVVEEAPAKMVYENDFSGQTVDTEHIALPDGGATVQSDGLLTADNIVDVKFGTFYAAKEGIPEPVYFEFTLSNVGLTRYSTPYVRIYLLGNGNTDNDIVGDIRWLGGSQKLRMVSANTSVANHIDVPCGNTIPVKVKMNPATDAYAVWVNGEEVLSEDAGKNYAKDDFDRVTGFYISMSGALEKLTMDNLKIYTEQAANIPALWEEISHEDFENDMTTAQNHGKVTLHSASGVSHSWKDGKITSTSNGKAWDYALTDDNGDAITGEYVVEISLPKDSSSTNRHRVYLYENMYIAWTSNSTYGGIMVRHWAPNDDQYQIGTNNAQFNAEDTLKITALINTTTASIKFWFNDIYAYEHTFNDTVMTSANSKIRFQPYGTASVGDIRVYRPVKGLMKAETDNTVKFAADSAKTGRLYFATYTGADETKSLANLGTAAMSLTPGKVYTVSKADWEGATVFYWDNDLKPIVDSWTIQ